jgi:uncharacterized sulfatase
MKKKTLLTAVLSVASALSVATAQPDRPNLLFIMLDDLGYGHCQFNNDELTVEMFDPYFKELAAQKQDYTPEQALELSRKAMPHLTTLAKGGIIFTRAYAPSSLCAPSRLAVATGQGLPESGIYTNMDVENSGLKPGTHLAEKLHDAGYGTAHIGKWHVGKRDYSIIRKELDKAGIKKYIYFYDLRNGHEEIYNKAWDAGYYGSVVPEQNPLNNGFDYYYGYNNWASQFYDSTLVWEGFKHAGRQEGYNTEVFTDKALDFMEQQIMNDKPFYVQLHLHAVHDYLEPNAPDRYWNGVRKPSYNLSNFYAHLQAVDQNIERITDYLKSQGMLENTIIAFTSDNGAMTGGPSVLPGNAPFSGHKGTFNQGGTRVPLFFYWPKGIKEGQVSDTLASSMDIIPTFIDAAGLQVPQNLQSKSLAGHLSGTDTTEVREQMIWAGIHARAWGHTIHKSPLTKNQERNKAPGGWAIVKGDYVLRYLGTVEDGLYSDVPGGSGPTLKLFNIAADPEETNDIASQMPELVETMKAAYTKRAANFIEPIIWNKEKYNELVK